MFAKNYHLHWIASRANILSKYIIYIFLNFRGGFCGSFPMLFSKAPASGCKKILNYFLLHCTSIFMSSKSVSQIFKILFQTGNINIFVLRGVFFWQICSTKKLLFWRKKHQWWSLRQILVEKLSKINEAKYYKKIPSLAEVGALQSYS